VTSTVIDGRWPNEDASPATEFSASSDDGLVRATVSAHLDVLRVVVAEECVHEEAETGIVQAVNRALEKAEGMPVDDLIRARDTRVAEFNAVLDGLEDDVARTRTSLGRPQRRRRRRNWPHGLGRGTSQ